MTSQSSHLSTMRLSLKNWVSVTAKFKGTYDRNEQQQILDKKRGEKIGKTQKTSHQILKLLNYTALSYLLNRYNCMTSVLQNNCGV